jgi:release factor glutamine methyltransferase
MPEPANEAVLAGAKLLTRPMPWAGARAIAGKLQAWGYRILGWNRYDDYRLERVHGVPLLVIPSVFNPKLLRTGDFLAAQLDSTLIGPDWSVLDMGTGSGVCALVAAQCARRVVAVDINPAAVRCAGVNALLNHLEHKIDVRLGDLFAPVASERFDLVLFNPPFLRGQPIDDRDRAWRSNNVCDRFAVSLLDHMTPRGIALVLLSSYGDASAFLEAFERHGLAISPFAIRQFVNERLVVFKLRSRETAMSV